MLPLTGHEKGYLLISPAFIFTNLLSITAVEFVLVAQEELIIKPPNLTQCKPPLLPPSSLHGKEFFEQS
jgi:hypothetical protein